MATFWQWVQGAGSIAGLGVTFFVLRDWFSRGRPLAYLVAKPLAGFGERQCYVRVKNNNERCLLVRVRPLAASPYRLVFDHSIRGTAGSAITPEFIFPIEGNEAHDVVLMLRSQPPKDRHAAQEIRLEWTWAELSWASVALTARGWPKWKPLKVRFDQSTLDRLTDGPNFDEEDEGR